MEGEVEGSVRGGRISQYGFTYSLRNRPPVATHIDTACSRISALMIYPLHTMLVPVAYLLDEMLIELLKKNPFPTHIEMFFQRKGLENIWI